MNGDPITPETVVPFALPGYLVGKLRDCDHIPSADEVIPDNHSNVELHRATQRWFYTTTERRVGKGRRYEGQATIRDALVVLGYLQSVADVLGGYGGPEMSREASQARRAVESARKSLSGPGYVCRLVDAWNGVSAVIDTATDREIDRD